MKDWVKELPVSITVCDVDGIIIEMNNKAKATFGGKDRIGESLYNCHQPRSIEMIRNMLKSGEPHTYTIEKAGMKKLIHQQAWYKDGNIAGLVEFSIILPPELPHYKRD